MSAPRFAARLAAAALLAAGCGTPPVGSFTVLATDARLLIGDVPDVDVLSRNVEVRRVSRLIGWVPTSGQPPTLRDALEEALVRGDGDLLINASVTRVAWYVPLLYGEYGWIVRGDVVRLRRHRAYSLDAELGTSSPHERPAMPPGSNDE